MHATQSPEAAGIPGGRLPAQSTPGEVLRTYRPLQILLIGLAFATGIFDVVTDLDFGHVFAANMTGNIVLLGLGVLRADDLSVPASVVAVASFVIGVAGGGQLARRLEPRGHRWVVTSLSVELGVLLLALLAAIARPMLGDSPVIALLACAMGLNNATVSLIRTPGLTTVIVLTSTLTTLVAGLQLPHGNIDTRVRQSAAVAAIFLGALSGVALLRLGAAQAIAAGVGLVLVATAAYVRTLPARSTRS